LKRGARRGVSEVWPLQSKTSCRAGGRKHSHADAAPADESGDGDEVRKPVENGGSTVADCHVGEENPDGRESQGSDGKSSRGGLDKDLRGLTAKSETVEHSRGSVESRVSGGEGRCEYSGVYLKEK